MKFITIFGDEFNGLEFVVYVVSPASIVLVILVYIFFNLRAIQIAFGFDFDINVLKRTGKTSQPDDKVIIKSNDNYDSSTDEIRDKVL